MTDIRKIIFACFIAATLCITGCNKNKTKETVDSNVTNTDNPGLATVSNTLPEGYNSEYSVPIPDKKGMIASFLDVFDFKNTDKISDRVEYKFYEPGNDYFLSLCENVAGKTWHCPNAISTLTAAYKSFTCVYNDGPIYDADIIDSYGKYSNTMNDILREKDIDILIPPNFKNAYTISCGVPYIDEETNKVCIDVTVTNNADNNGLGEICIYGYLIHDDSVSEYEYIDIILPLGCTSEYTIDLCNADELDDDISAYTAKAFKCGSNRYVSEGIMEDFSVDKIVDPSLYSYNISTDHDELILDMSKLDHSKIYSAIFYAHNEESFFFLRDIDDISPIHGSFTALRMKDIEDYTIDAVVFETSDVNTEQYYYCCYDKVSVSKGENVTINVPLKYKMNKPDLIWLTMHYTYEGEYYADNDKLSNFTFTSADGSVVAYGIESFAEKMAELPKQDYVTVTFEVSPFFDIEDAEIWYSAYH